MKWSVMQKILIILFSFLPYQAHAGFLDDLNSTLTKLDNTNKTSSSQAQQKNNLSDSQDTNDVMAVLDIESKHLENTAIAGTFNRNYLCSEKYLSKRGDEVLNLLQRGEYINAGMSASYNSAIFSKCALTDSSGNLMYWVPMVGHFEAVTLMMSKKTGMTTSETPFTEDRAKTTLTYAANHGSSSAKNDLQMLKNNGFFAEKLDSDRAEMTISSSARDIAEQYSSNTFAFQRKYGGKKIRVTGPLRVVSGKGTGASLIITGIVRKNKDDKSWRDEIKCDVSDSSSLDKASVIKSGNKVTVEGIYQPAQGELMVILRDCRID